MSQTFAAEKATEEERIAAALRSEPPGPLIEEQSSGRVKVTLSDEATTQVDSRLDPLRATGLKLALGTLVVAGLLVAGLWAAGWLPLDDGATNVTTHPRLEEETEPGAESTAVEVAPAPDAPVAEAEGEPASEVASESEVESEAPSAPRSGRTARRSRRRRPRMAASPMMEPATGVSQTGLLNSPYGMM